MFTIVRQNGGTPDAVQNSFAHSPKKEKKIDGIHVAHNGVIYFHQKQ